MPMTASQIAEECGSSVERDLALHGVDITERDRVQIECIVAGIVHRSHGRRLLREPEQDSSGEALKVFRDERVAMHGQSILAHLAGKQP